MFGSGTAEYDLRDAIAAANHGNVTISVVDPRGLGAGTRAADSMYRLAAETGGRTIVNTNDFEIGLREVVADASAYYLIGYTPTRAEDDGKYHKISVKVKRSGDARDRAGRLLGAEPQADRGGGGSGEQAAGGRRRERDAGDGPPRAARRGAGLGGAVAKPPTARRRPRRPGSRWPARTPSGRTAWNSRWCRRAARRRSARRSSLPAASPGKPARSLQPRIVAPGDFLLRFTARSADGEPLDRWEEPLSVPDLSSVAVALATPKFFIASSVQELRELQAAADPTPRALRTFRQTDRVFIQLEVLCGPWRAATCR